MGCLKALFVRIGCLAIVVIGLALAFVYREQVQAVYRRMRGLPPPATAEFSPPAADGTRRAGEALAGLARRDGPAYVDLTAGDVAALIEDALAAEPRRRVDSVAVSLGDERITVRASLDVTDLSGAVLGPLAGAIGPREPLTVSGRLRPDSAGGLRWEITDLTVRDFPFPRGTLTALVRQLRIPGASEASVPLPGFAAAGDARVTPVRVRVYRRSP